MVRCGGAPIIYFLLFPHAFHELQTISHIMRGWKGLRLRRPAVRIWRWATGNRPKGYLRLTAAPTSSPPRCRSMTKKLSNCFRRLLRQRTSYESSSDKTRNPPPKGHLPVYVGESPSPSRRYVVPLVYFSHPLFRELLQEAVKEVGYGHQGGITIPCTVDRFERVKTMIAAADDGWKLKCWGYPPL